MSIPLLLCPSDSGQQTGLDLPDNVTTQQDLDTNGPWARGNYAANAGPGYFHFTQRGQSSKPNLGGVMGINWGVTLGELTQQDGASNTILFNEVRVGIEARDRQGRVWALGLAGSSVTAANASIGDCPTPNDREPLSDDIEDCHCSGIPNSAPAIAWAAPMRNAPRNWANWQAQARSRHPGGVNACFADGSVRFVRDSIGSGVWEVMLAAMTARLTTMIFKSAFTPYGTDDENQVHAVCFVHPRLPASCGWSPFGIPGFVLALPGPGLGLPLTYRPKTDRHTWLMPLILKEYATGLHPL